MTPRVTRLRRETLDTKPWLSAERARLLTAFYRTAPAASVPVTRALAFAYLLDHKTIYIGPDELIVGERGEAPKGAPTYPELCCHSLEDLDVLARREKISFAVADEVRSAYAQEVIPFWQGRSMRDAVFEEMTDEWKAAYETGVFTEFMEQRAPGHTVLGDTIYHKGFLDLQADIDQALSRLDSIDDAARVRQATAAQGHAHCRWRDHPLRGTPRRPRSRPCCLDGGPTAPPRSSSALPRPAPGSRPDPRARSGKPSRPTGSCTLASSPS